MKMQVTTSMAKRVTGIVLAAALMITTCTACGANHKEDAISCTDSFLKTAQSGDVVGAGAYATEDVMKDLSWTQEDLDSLKDVYVSAFLPSDMDSLKELPEIEESLNSMIKKLASLQLKSYEIDEAAYEEKDGVCTVSANITGLSDSSVSTVLTSAITDVTTEAQDLFSTYMQEHPEVTEMTQEELYTALYTEFMPKIMDLIIEKLDAADADNLTWKFQLEEQDGKMVITGLDTNQSSAE